MFTIEGLSIKRLGEFGSAEFSASINRERGELATSEDGVLEVPFISPGSYRVDVRKRGFRDGFASPIEVYAGSSKSVRIVMAVEE
jgi:hypothetical protein